MQNPENASRDLLWSGLRESFLSSGLAYLETQTVHVAARVEGKDSKISYLRRNLEFRLESKT